METIPVLCNNCGATLDIDERTKFATCRFCGSKLAIKHSDSTVYSEVLEEIRETSQKVAGNLEVVKLQNELERIDREWMIESRKYEDDKGKLPDGGNVVGSVIGGIIGFVFLIFWISKATEMGAPAIFPIFGIGMLVFMIFGFFSSASDAEKYSTVKESYESRRAKVLEKLKQAERES